MKMVRAELCIKGRVQGVFYRQSTKETATALGLTGWVRNLENGDVDAVVEGPETAIQNLIEWCWIGPPAAHVSDITTEWSSAQDQFSDFSVR